LPRDADGGGSAMTYPREWESTFRIAADAPLGTKFWRVSSGWGGTQFRPFLVGDLPEFIETEPNSEPEQAERLTLPVVVNGQIAGERDLDFYLFSAHAGEVVVFDVMAARLGSPLDPVLEIADLAGRRMEVEEVRAGTDPVLAFRAPATGDYRVSVANVSFHGGPQYVYRMTVSTVPFVAYAMPPAGKVGTARDLLAYTLTGTASPHAAYQRITFPNRAGPFRLGGSIALLADSDPEMVVSDVHHSPAQSLKLTLPIIAHGQFRTASAEDWFQFTANKDEAISVCCRPFPVTSAALPELALFNTTGQILAKAGAADSPDHESFIDWKAPADGIYRLRLRDLEYGTRGGPDFIYRLQVRRGQPDFELHLEPDFVNVVQGGKTEFDLSVRRLGGFDRAIYLNILGLPDGVRIEPMQIAAGQTRLEIAVVVKDDARPTDATLRLVGKATVNGKTIERPASVTPTGVSRDEWERLPFANELALTIQHKPVFRLTCNEAYQYANRGTIYPYAMQVERLNGFKGPITIQLCDRQVQDLDGLEVIETVVPPSAKEFNNLVYLPENMHVGIQHHSRPYAQGYATFTDKWGQSQTLLAISDHRNMIRTMPTLVMLLPAQPEVIAGPGSSLPCKFTLVRTPQFKEAMQLELMPTKGITAQKVNFEAGRNDVVVNVQVDALEKLSTEKDLQFRASAKLPSGSTVVSLAKIKLKIR
jgi:hypothetical protein